MFFSSLKSLRKVKELMASNSVLAYGSFSLVKLRRMCRRVPEKLPMSGYLPRRI